MMMMGEFVTVTSLMTLAVVRNLLLLFSLLLAHNNGWGGVSCGIFAVMHNTEHTEWLIQFPPRENSAQTCRRCLTMFSMESTILRPPLFSEPHVFQTLWKKVHSVSLTLFMLNIVKHRWHVWAAPWLQQMQTVTSHRKYAVQLLSAPRADPCLDI